MCGRFTLTVSGQLLAEVFRTDQAPLHTPRYNVAPTQSMPILRLDRQGARGWAVARWGLVPTWAKNTKMGARLINARSETAAEKPAFRSALRRRRCLVPADGFYEWQRRASGKQPHHIRFFDRRVFAFAGLWEWWAGDEEYDQFESFSILTTEPNTLVKKIHDRMPVILPPNTWDHWLEPVQLARKDLERLLRPHDADEMEAVPVDPRVGSPQNDDPSLLDETGQLSLFS